MTRHKGPVTSSFISPRALHPARNTGTCTSSGTDRRNLFGVHSEIFLLEEKDDKKLQNHRKGYYICYL